MSLFTAFQTDPDKEASGFWFEDTGVINEDKTTPGFLIARASRANPKFAKASEKLGKKYQRQLANDLLPTEKALELNKRILVEWSAYGMPTDIEWVFTARRDGTTFVSITNSGFGGSPQEIASNAVGSTEGFSFVLAGAKALLEHNVLLNLVPDRFPDGLAR